MTQDLSHLNQQGEVHMVDVGDRPTTHREAHARGAIRMDASTLGLILSLIHISEPTRRS